MTWLGTNGPIARLLVPKRLGRNIVGSMHGERRLLELLGPDALPDPEAPQEYSRCRGHKIDVKNRKLFPGHRE